MAAKKSTKARVSKAKKAAVDSFFDTARKIKKLASYALEPSYTYRAKLNRVVDGDTVWLDVDLGFHVTMAMNFRLAGINCPEVVGATKEAGLAAKAETLRLLQLGSITVKSQKTEKYGRWLGSIFVTDTEGKIINVSTELVAGGFAVVYMEDK